MDNSINIKITQEKQKFINNPAIEVFVNDVKKAKIKGSETVDIRTEKGEQTVSFRYLFRRTDINADFQQDATISVRLNRGSGEIEARLLGASETQQQAEWESQPRDKNMVYPDKRKTSPFVALILSIIIVGLGQMVNGQLIKGLLMLAAAMVLGALTGGVAGVVIWIISGIDAYTCVNKLKQGRPIGMFSFF